MYLSKNSWGNLQCLKTLLMMRRLITGVGGVCLFVNEISIWTISMLRDSNLDPNHYHCHMESQA